MIIDKLINQIEQKQNPACVGLDPGADLADLTDSAGLADLVDLTTKDGIIAFNSAIIEAIYDIVPAVKPQIAFYERLGPHGLEAYAETVKLAKAKGLIVIGDIKRGDIASTAQAYADAHLGPSPFEVDFATINPYLGRDSAQPFLDNCRKYDKGLFVLVKTSNAGSADFQDLRLACGNPLYKVVGDVVEEWGLDLVGRNGYSAVGAVVGATHPEILKKMRQSLPRTFFLVPGFGAQGGTVSDIAEAFDLQGKGAVINSSRGIIAAYKNEKYKGLDFAQAAREAALEMRNELRSIL